jgi:hypothetical protein
VPLLVLFEVRNAPPMVVVPVMVNTADEAEFVITDGSAVVAVPNVHGGAGSLGVGKLLPQSTQRG